MHQSLLSILLPDISEVLHHGDNEGNDQQTPHYGGELTSLVSCLLLGLEVGHPLGVRHLGSARVRQLLDCVG